MTDMQTLPVEVDGSRQLFVDDGVVMEARGVERRIHQPKKYVGNPLLLGDYFHDARAGVRGQEDGAAPEGGVEKFCDSLMPCSAVRNESGLFQMYYHTRLKGLKDYGYCGGTPVVAYAESHNGVHWHLPELDRVELGGSKSNNVLFEPPGSLPCVVIDEHDPDPTRRYKMLFYNWKESFSPDGRNWSEPESVKVPSKIGWSDGLNCLAGWDERIDRYVAYFRPMLACPEQKDDSEGKTIRTIGRSETEDFKEWSDLKAVLFPDEKDPPDTEFQCIMVSMYEGMYVGLLCYQEGYSEERGRRFAHREGKWPVHSAMLGRCHVELVSSRDGINWQRTRTPFIDNTPGGLDSGLIWAPSAPIRVGDELWFYYGASFHDHALSAVQLPCLAKLRRDGFASMSAGEQPGWVVTRPFKCPGGRLFVNADACNGELSVAVIEEDGYHHPRYAKVRCAAFDRDSVSHNVSWMEQRDIDLLRGRTIQLKFYLRNADLFSFWFD